MKNFLKWLLGTLGIFVLMSTFGSIISSEETQTVVPRPYEGISVDELMKIKYAVKYTTFARDYHSIGDFWMVDKKGYRRHRRFSRSRIILNRPSDGICYKDLVVMTEPYNIRGLAILSWSYLNPEREQDIWLWLPSLKKIRKVSQASADDSFMGSDFTTEEVSVRRFEDETYRMIGEEIFKGYHSEFNNKTYHKDIPCYVVEATPKRKNWYYSRRVLWISKEYGAAVFEEYYDQLGRKSKALFRAYEYVKDYPAQVFLECKDLRTEHLTAIEMDNIEFDKGLDERFFTQKTLMRSRW